MARIFYILENATALGERMRVVHRWFDIIELVTFVRCTYSILCPLGPGALSGNKKLKA